MYVEGNLYSLKNELSFYYKQYINAYYRSVHLCDAILSVEDVLSRSPKTKELYNKILIEMANLCQRRYGFNCNLNHPGVCMSLLNYFLLMTDVCYVITPDKVSSTGEIIRVDKELYTYSYNELLEMFNRGLLGSTQDQDVVNSVGRAFEDIKSGKSVRKSIGNVILDAYRLDCNVFSVDRNTAINYTVRKSRAGVDISEKIIIPRSLYEMCLNKVIELLVKQVCIFKSGKNVIVSTANKDTLIKIYGEEKYRSIENLIGIFGNGKFVIPDLGSSSYCDCVRELNVEYIDEVMIDYDNKIISNLVDGNEVTIQFIDELRKNISLKYINIDTRGAKSFLKNYVKYNSLSYDKRFTIDQYTDTDAYAWLDRNNIEGFIPYSQTLGCGGTEIDIPQTKWELMELLASGVYRIDIIGKNGEKSILCSNDTKVLTEIYGADYRVKFKTLRSRISEALSIIDYFEREGKLYSFYEFIKDLYTKFGIIVEYRENKISIQNIRQQLSNMLESLGTSKRSLADDDVIVADIESELPRSGERGNFTKVFPFENIKSIVKIR